MTITPIFERIWDSGCSADLLEIAWSHTGGPGAWTQVFWLQVPRFSHSSRDWIKTHTWPQWAVPAPYLILFSSLGIWRPHFPASIQLGRVTWLVLANEGWVVVTGAIPGWSKEGLFCDWFPVSPALRWWLRKTNVSCWGHREAASWISSHHTWRAAALPGESPRPALELVQGSDQVLC